MWRSSVLRLRRRLNVYPLKAVLISNAFVQAFLHARGACIHVCVCVWGGGGGRGVGVLPDHFLGVLGVSFYVYWLLYCYESAVHFLIQRTMNI